LTQRTTDRPLASANHAVAKFIGSSMTRMHQCQRLQCGHLKALTHSPLHKLGATDVSFGF